MRLNAEDIKFLLSFTREESSIAKVILSIKPNTDISVDLADELRDHCTDRLDTHGFDINYNPTEEGKRLEDLIDKLYVG